MNTETNKKCNICENAKCECNYHMGNETNKEEWIEELRSKFSIAKASELVLISFISEQIKLAEKKAFEKGQKDLFIPIQKDIESAWEKREKDVRNFVIDECLDTLPENPYDQLDGEWYDGAFVMKMKIKESLLNLKKK